MFCDFNSLNQLAKTAISIGCDIYVTPYYEVSLVRSRSFNSRHEEFVLSIKPQDIIDCKFEQIRESFMLQRDYLIGFDEEILPTNAEDFVKELLLPCYFAKDAERKIPKGLEYSYWDNRNRCFNWSMTVNCLTYAFEIGEINFEFQCAMKAPCFMPDAFSYLKVIDTCTVGSAVEGLYLRDKLRRMD